MSVAAQRQPFPAAAAEGDSFHIHSCKAALQSVWRESATTGVSTPFQSWRWLESVSQRLAQREAESWFAMEWRRDGDPMMLLPLRRVMRAGVRTIEFLDGGVSDYNAPVIGASGRVDAALFRRIWPAMRSRLPPADLIKLEKMPARIGGAINPLAQFPHAKRMHFGAWGVALPSSFDSLQQTSFTQPFARKMAERWRRLAKAGGATFQVADTPDAIKHVFDELTRQRVERYKALGRNDILADPVWHSHYRDMLDARDDAPDGMRTRAHLLYLTADGAIIAVGYGIRHGDAFHMILVSFEAERWRNYSPGIQLFRMSMQWAIEQKLTFFDFTIGDEPYKRDFGASETPLFELTEGLTPLGIAVTLAGDLRRRLKQAVRDCRDRFGKDQEAST